MCWCIAACIKDGTLASSRERVLPEAFGDPPEKKNDGRPSVCSPIDHILLNIKIPIRNMIFILELLFNILHNYTEHGNNVY